MTLRPIVFVALAALLAGSCGRGRPTPEAVVAGREACTYCRMTFSQVEFASQVVAPGELPKFFDDLGCLSHFLTATTEVPAGAVVYVTDHRTREWVAADAAVFARVKTLPTPMSSHLVAHASRESREADPLAVGGLPVTVAEVVPAAWQAQGGRR